MKYVNIARQQGKWCNAKTELSSIAPEVTEPSPFSAQLTPAACTDDSDESEADWLSRRCCRRCSILLCNIRRKDGWEPDAVPCEDVACLSLDASRMRLALVASCEVEVAMELVCCEPALLAGTDVPAVSASTATALSVRLVSELEGAAAPGASVDVLSQTAGRCCVTADLAGEGLGSAEAVLLCGGGAFDVCWLRCTVGDSNAGAGAGAGAVAGAGADAGADGLCSAKSFILSAVLPFTSAQSSNRHDCEHRLIAFVLLLYAAPSCSCHRMGMVQVDDNSSHESHYSAMSAAKSDKLSFGHAACQLTCRLWCQIQVLLTTLYR